MRAILVISLLAVAPSAIEARKLQIAGARYDRHTGRVPFIE
jgi:hypothetical protein